MPVRTARLAAGTVAAGANAFIVTCPAGKTIIIKDIRLWNTTGTATNHIVSVNSGPASTWIRYSTVAGNDTPAMSPWIVLEPGDTLSMYTQHSAMAYHVSGTELDGVAP